MRNELLEKLSKQDVQKIGVNLFFYTQSGDYLKNPKIYSSQKRASSVFHNNLDYKVNRFTKSVSSLISSAQIKNLVNNK
jgi:hypothetical protein